MGNWRVMGHHEEGAKLSYGQGGLWPRGGVVAHRARLTGTLNPKEVATTTEEVTKWYEDVIRCHSSQFSCPTAVFSLVSPRGEMIWTLARLLSWEGRQERSLLTHAYDVSATSSYGRSRREDLVLFCPCC